VVNVALPEVIAAPPQCREAADHPRFAIQTNVALRGRKALVLERYFLNRIPSRLSDLLAEFVRPTIGDLQ